MRHDKEGSHNTYKEIIKKKKNETKDTERKKSPHMARIPRGTYLYEVDLPERTPVEKRAYETVSICRPKKPTYTTPVLPITTEESARPTEHSACCTARSAVIHLLAFTRGR
jgi:hypothetical protein